MKRGELSRGLAQLNRALAYAPGHRGAEALLATISSRRRWVKLAGALAVVAVAGAAIAGVRGVRHRLGAPASSLVSRPPVNDLRAALPAAVAPPAAVVAPLVAAAPPVVVAPPSAVASPPVVGAKRTHVRRPSATAAAPPSAPAETFEAVSEPIAPPPPIAVAAPRVAPPPPLAGITLRARQGFCSPSLDDRPPALRPIYEGVSIGLHQIYCTPPGGVRALAGTYELRAGTHPNVIVVPGPDGRPTLARPE
jgi:hypothetical protein